MKKLAVFDVDGTILDSFGHFTEVLKEYSALNGLPAPCIATIRRGHGEPDEHDFKWGVPRGEQARHLYAAYRMADERVTKGGHRPELFRGVEEAVLHLKDLGFLLAIVTSRKEESLAPLLEYHGIGGHFSAIRTRDDIERRGEAEKPAPDQLKSVIRELGSAPDITVMIGDTTMDMRMGRGAGAFALGVTWGTHSRPMLEGAGAHDIVETHFPDVIPAVRKRVG